MQKQIKSEWDERGQSLAEMALALPFLLILLVAAFELAQAFTVYIGVINGAREGAMYAASNPDLSQETDLNNCTHVSQTICDSYTDRVKGEIIALGLNTTNLTVSIPLAPNGENTECPISSTLTFNLTTFSSSISLPLVGRMGLPNSYTISYTVGMPIRNSNLSMSCVS